MPPPVLSMRPTSETIDKAVVARSDAPRKDSEADDWAIESFVGASNFNPNQLHKRELAHRLEAAGFKLERGAQKKRTDLYKLYL